MKSHEQRGHDTVYSEVQRKKLKITWNHFDL